MPELAPSPIFENEPIVTIGSKTYVIRPFVVEKFLRAMTIIARLLDETDVAAFFTQKDQTAFIPILLKKLPVLIESGEPHLMRLCALILTSNAQIREIIGSDGSIDRHLDQFSKDLASDEDFDVEKLINTLVYGVDQMGIQAIRKNAGKVQEIFRKVTTG